MLAPSLLEPFVTRLERLGVRYFVTGSTAGILYGEPRLTNDVDIVVALSLREVHDFKADIYIAHDELHRWALDHRRAIKLDQLSMSVAPIEYVILRKLEYFREGGSQKHVRDIRGMLEVSASQIDQSSAPLRGAARPGQAGPFDHPLLATVGRRARARGRVGCDRRCHGARRAVTHYGDVAPHHRCTAARAHARGCRSGR